MTLTVIDSTDLAAQLADAGYEPPEPRIDPTKPDAKPDAKTETEDPDDVEGPDGLTPRQKKEMSTAMLKSIGKKHRQMKDAEDFAAAQLKRTQELERENLELKGKIPQPKEIVEPKREAFATEEEFVEAKIQYGVDQGIKKRDAEREEANRLERANKRLAEAKEIVPDFEAVTAANLNWPGAVAHYMRGSDMFAELGYHFAKNPAELTRIANLRPEQQLVAVGKIEATLSPFGAKASKDESSTRADVSASTSTDTGFSPSKAREAPVIKPLSSGEGQQFEPEVRDMNVREHIQAWQKEAKVDLRRRKRH